LIDTCSSNISNKEKANKIIISPNPVQDELVIRGISKEERYRIIDISGREFVRGKIMPNQTISVSNLPNGIYIFQVLNGTKELKYGKFIKAK